MSQSDVNWKPRTIGVGTLGSIPLVAVSKLTVDQVSNLPDHISTGKLVSYDALPHSIDKLDELIKKFVPSTATADDWREFFQKFRVTHPGPIEDQFKNFTALLYARTNLPPSVRGHLLVSSVCTYLKYIAVKELFFLRSEPCFKAIETQAGSIGTTRIAPKLGASSIDCILEIISDPSRDIVLRLGFWFQCHGGCRCTDVSRVRENAIDWKDNDPSVNQSDEVQALIWRWAKNIRSGSQTQYCPTLAEVTEVFGPPPVTQIAWKQMCAAKEYPLEGYNSSIVNATLKELFEGAASCPTSTSLRDCCHRILWTKYGGKASEMIAHTVHRTTKSMQATYSANRPEVSVPNTPTKKITPTKKADSKTKGAKKEVTKGIKKQKSVTKKSKSKKK